MRISTFNIQSYKTEFMICWILFSSIFVYYLITLVHLSSLFSFFFLIYRCTIPLFLSLRVSLSPLRVSSSHTNSLSFFFVGIFLSLSLQLLSLSFHASPISLYLCLFPFTSSLSFFLSFSHFRHSFENKLLETASIECVTQPVG